MVVNCYKQNSMGVGGHDHDKFSDMNEQFSVKQHILNDIWRSRRKNVVIKFSISLIRKDKNLMIVFYKYQCYAILIIIWYYNLLRKIILNKGYGNAKEMHTFPSLHTVFLCMDDGWMEYPKDT